MLLLLLLKWALQVIVVLVSAANETDANAVIDKANTVVPVTNFLNIEFIIVFS
jgi:hypothetical protein